jgi:hypothetical protein
MANQSTVQSLLQQLAGTASAGQANLPSGINNGNPNTIYNQPQTPAPLTGNVPQWPLAPSNINWQQLAANAPGNDLAHLFPKYPAIMPSFNVPGWGGAGQPPPPTTTGNPPPGTPPPPVIPPGGVNTGGNLPPGTQPGNHGGGPGQQNPNAGHGLNTFGDSMSGLDNFDFSTFDMQGLMNGGQHGIGSTTQVNPGSLVGTGTQGGIGSSFMNGLLNTVEAKTGTTNGVSWQQVVDALVLPGNAYLSASQKWDVSNLLAGLAQKFTGIPVNNIMNAAGKYLLANPNKMTWLPKFLRNILTSHYKDNATNAALARQNLANQPRNQHGGGGVGINGAGNVGTFSGGHNAPGSQVGSYYVWDKTGVPLTYGEYVNNVEGTALDRGWAGTDGRGGGGFGGLGSAGMGGFGNMDAGGAFGGQSGGTSRGTGWATGTNGQTGAGSGSISGLPIDNK